jgi:membrane-bound metal-dependent hydrolase YbcI (DUF457 family)
MLTTPLTLAFLWLILANVIAMLPSKDRHWRAAGMLIAVGIPILGWVTWTEGPVWGLLLLAGAASVLRWPLIHLFRKLKRMPDAPAE